MIKYDESKNEILVNLPHDDTYEINGNTYRAWDVDFGNGTVYRIGEYNMECEVVNEDGTYKPEDEEIAFYASYDDTLYTIYTILF